MNDSPPAAGSSRFPTFARLFSWRTLGRIAVGLAVLATLIALVCAEENWRGKWAWEKYKRQLEAQGEQLDWKAFVPPPVPDAQNFAMTPFLAPLYDFNPLPLKAGQSRWRDTNGFQRATSFASEVGKFEGSINKPNANRTEQRMTDLQAWALALTGQPFEPVSTMDAKTAAVYRRRYGEPISTETGPPAAPKTNAPPLTRSEAAAEVLRALEQYNPVLEEVRRASRRPYARFNIRYEGEFAPAILLPHLAVVKHLASVFQLRASAELAAGQTDQAWADTQMALYLADTLKNEPFLISKLVQLACVKIALRPIWEGLAERQWSDRQLAEIEKRLGQVDLLADAALRGERAFSLLTVAQLRHSGSLQPDDPRGGARPLMFLLGGFFYQNELFIARMYEQFFVPTVDDASQRIYPSRAAAGEKALTKAMAHGFAPYHLLGKILLPALAGASSKLGFGQTRVDEAIVACALERYRLAQGQFPESLEPLCPQFLEKLPHDIITGAPLKYRRTPDSQFILYSVGWNEKDDGGEVVLNPSNQPSSDLTKGDWVWEYPPPAPTTAGSP